MIKKQSGKINEIVYDLTVYGNGKYRLRPDLSMLINLLHKVIESEETTESLNIIPFFINDEDNWQEEFDSHMMFIKCQDDVSNAEYINFLKETKDDGTIFVSRDAKKRFMLCRYDETEKFAGAIKNYLLHLYDLIPEMLEILKTRLELSDEELKFGHFCFLVTSHQI